MTHQEIAASLRLMADVYDKQSPEDHLIQPNLLLFANTKQEIIDLVHAIGGRFTKDMGNPDGAYPNVTLTSMRIPGLRILIPRDSVCKKRVTWDCEPLLNDGEEAELEAAMLG